MRRLHTLGLALAVLALSALAWWHPTPAAAEGKDGHCTDDQGVTVVIDFQKLGGGTIVRCADDFTGGTGLDVLYGAGISLEGTKRWGEGFICRIENRPSASEKLPIQGNVGYQEPCIDTPPAAGYWSYWHAENGGSWTYSQMGVKNRNAIVGGYEGWSFSLNATATTNPAPGIAPQRPEPEPEPEPTDSTTAPDDDGGGASPRPGKGGSDHADPKSEGKKSEQDEQPGKKKGTQDRSDPTSSSSPSARATPTPTPTPTLTPTPTPPPTPTPSTGPSGDRSTATESGSAAAPTATVQSPDGPPLGTLLGVGGVVGLGAVSAIVLGLRRGGGG